MEAPVGLLECCGPAIKQIKYDNKNDSRSIVKAYLSPLTAVIQLTALQ